MLRGARHPCSGLRSGINSLDLHRKAQTDPVTRSQLIFTTGWCSCETSSGRLDGLRLTKIEPEVAKLDYFRRPESVDLQDNLKASSGMALSDSSRREVVFDQQSARGLRPNEGRVDDQARTIRGGRRYDLPNKDPETSNRRSDLAVPIPL